MTAAVALGIALWVPNVLRLSQAPPSIAAALWLSSLLLRALFVTLAAVSLLALIPGSAPFYALSNWCWNAMIPFFGSHLGVSGARLVQAAVIFPLVMLVSWAAMRIVQIIKSHREVRRSLEASSLGKGPSGSMIVGGSDVMLAAVGLVRPEVVLSAGALTWLDDEELEAGIAHEQGHIARRHRWWIAVAEVCGSVARLLPGTGYALRQFKFHVERDADHWAVERTLNPLALASAICKSTSNPRGAIFALSGTGAVDRVDQLLAAKPGSRMSVPTQKFAASLATLLVIVSIVFVLSVSSATTSGVKHLEAHAPSIHCPL